MDARCCGRGHGLHSPSTCGPSLVAIAPFRALRYMRDHSAVTSPPHDCITDAERDAFLAKDERNIVRIVKGPDEPGDDEANGPNRFTRAAAAMKALMAQGMLARDDRPAFYHYAITHGPAGARRTMHGLLARLRLDATYKEVRRHERTLRRPKRDRLRVREHTACDTEPIWLLYRDPRGWVDEILASNAFDELVRFSDEEGHEHRLWRVDRPEAVTEVVAQFDDRSLVIADGHHRYQTALDHFQATGRPEHGSILVCLVRDNDPGLDLVATHRLVHGTGLTLDRALRSARGWDAEELGRRTGPLDAWPLDLQRAAGQPGARTPVLVGRREDGLAACRLVPKSPAPGGGKRAVDGLAVTLVHDRLLQDAWGIDLSEPERHLRFTRDAVAAVRAVDQGQAELAVLLPPEPVSAVLDVAQQGDLMPQKATYFVPKLRSGLVLSPLDEPPPVPWRELAGEGGPADFRRLPLT
jgi:uncharacterized protein (DUF1015 family)